MLLLLPFTSLLQLIEDYEDAAVGLNSIYSIMNTYAKLCTFGVTRYFAYSDALGDSFFPRTIPMWNCLPSSVVSSKTTGEFKAQI